MSTKVCVLTSVHPPFDNRVFYKECVTLASRYQVVLIVPYTNNETIKNVNIRAVPIPKNRWERIFKTIWSIYFRALKEKAQVYHFHDPELILVGLLLKIQGKKVIYDIHEDYITSFKQKKYLLVWFRNSVSFLICGAERMLSRFFLVILAEKYYQRRFPKGITILNYPILDTSLASVNRMIDFNRPKLIYTGNITEDRGALIHADIVNHIKNVELFMIGRCHRRITQKIEQIAGNEIERIVIDGIDRYVPFKEISDYYKKGEWIAGLAIFPPTPHYQEKELTKFFEYMIAGIPIICSKFTVWETLIKNSKCGLVVNPNDMDEIARAIQWLIGNPDEAKNMGEMGRLAVKNQYNWSFEAEKLLNLYQKILS